MRCLNLMSERVIATTLCSSQWKMLLSQFNDPLDRLHKEYLFILRNIGGSGTTGILMPLFLPSLIISLPGRSALVESSLQRYSSH